MTTKSSDLEPTLADAFEVGKKEGLKEAFTEIKNMLSEGTDPKAMEAYVKARLKSIQDFTSNNPFKTKG